eukprot:GFYU01005419.1.p1 GENE.GFYU01005419.1~~GFYU01005419.1.p1  ORF type:complete len:774 (-),score=191.79 GFYU01005419.1:115-2436(-)
MSSPAIPAVPGTDTGQSKPGNSDKEKLAVLKTAYKNLKREKEQVVLQNEELSLKLETNQKQYDHKVKCFEQAEIELRKELSDVKHLINTDAAEAIMNQRKDSRSPKLEPQSEGFFDSILNPSAKYEEEIAALKKTIDQLESLNKKLRLDLKEVAQVTQDKSIRIEVLENDKREMEKERDEAQSAVGAANLELAETKIAKDAAAGEAAKLKSENESLTEKVETAEKELRETKSALLLAEHTISNLNEELEEERDALGPIVQEKMAAEDQLGEVQVLMDSLRTENASLKVTICREQMHSDAVRKDFEKLAKKYDILVRNLKQTGGDMQVNAEYVQSPVSSIGTPSTGASALAAVQPSDAQLQVPSTLFLDDPDQTLDLDDDLDKEPEQVPDIMPRPAEPAVTAPIVVADDVIQPPVVAPEAASMSNGDGAAVRSKSMSSEWEVLPGSAATQLQRDASQTFTGGGQRKSGTFAKWFGRKQDPGTPVEWENYKDSTESFEDDTFAAGLKVLHSIVRGGIQDSLKVTVKELIVSSSVGMVQLAEPSPNTSTQEDDPINASVVTNVELHQTEGGTTVMKLCCLVEGIFRHCWKGSLPECGSLFWLFVEREKFLEKTKKKQLSALYQTIQSLPDFGVWTAVTKCCVLVILALNEKLLSTIVEEVLQDAQFISAWYDQNAFLRDEECVSILLARLRGLDGIHFNMDSAPIARSAEQELESKMSKRNVELGDAEKDNLMEKLAVVGLQPSESLEMFQKMRFFDRNLFLLFCVRPTASPGAHT